MKKKKLQHRDEQRVLYVGIGIAFTSIVMTGMAIQGMPEDQAGPLILIVVGSVFTLLFTMNQLLNVKYYRVVEFLGFGEVYLDESPKLYWFLSSLLLLPFVVMVVVGVLLLI